MTSETPKEIVTLSTGVRAVIKPVPSMLVDKLVSKIKDPVVPKQYIEEKDREELNPLDPEYLKAVDEANRRRGEVTMEAMVMYGIELVDGVPDLDEWLPKLQWIEKRSELDLKEYDLDDPFDLEYVFKAFVATSGVDLMLVTMKSGMTNQEVDLSMRGFQGDEESSTDREGAPSE